MGCYLESKENVLFEKHHREPAEHPPPQRQEPSPSQSTSTAGAGDESPGRSWVQLTDWLWRPTTQPTHQTKLDGGGAEALAKSDLKFPNPWGEGTKSIFHQEIQQPSGTVSSPGVKHALLLFKSLNKYNRVVPGRSLSLMAK